jgi:hypothetical protein
LTDISHIISCEKVVEYSIFNNEDIDDYCGADIALSVSAEVVPPNSLVFNIFTIPSTIHLSV